MMSQAKQSEIIQQMANATPEIILSKIKMTFSPYRGETSIHHSRCFSRKLENLQSVFTVFASEYKKNFIFLGIYVTLLFFNL